MNMYNMCLEDKIIKQMGSNVAFRNLAHMPSRKCLIIRPCVPYQHGFSTQRWWKNRFFWQIFLLLVFQAHICGIICCMKHSQLLFAKTRGTGFLSGQFLLLMPVSYLHKRMVCDHFSFHPSLSSRSLMPPPLITTDSPKFLLSFLTSLQIKEPV